MGLINSMYFASASLRALQGPQTLVSRAGPELISLFLRCTWKAKKQERRWCEPSGVTEQMSSANDQAPTRFEALLLHGLQSLERTRKPRQKFDC